MTLNNFSKKGLQNSRPFLCGRDERIRTSDFLHPMQALYQAELRPEDFVSIYRKTAKCKQNLPYSHICYTQDKHQNSIHQTQKKATEVAFYKKSFSKFYAAILPATTFLIFLASSDNLASGVAIK